MLVRVAWRSVADIVTRVVADRAGRIDRLTGLRRIGIDEISYRTHVSADGAQWIHDVVGEGAPAAVLCLDAFYGDLRVMPRSGPLGLVAGPSAVRRSA
jgi:hypothetical protein